MSLQGFRTKPSRKQSNALLVVCSLGHTAKNSDVPILGRLEKQHNLLPKDSTTLCFGM